MAFWASSVGGCDTIPYVDFLVSPEGVASVVELPAPTVVSDLRGVDTVLVIPPNAPFYPAVDLAVAPDGTIALAHPRRCTIRLHNPDGRFLGQIGSCGDEDRVFRSLAEMFWLDTEHLGVLDTGDEIVHVYGRDRSLRSRVPLLWPESGLITSSYLLGTETTVISFEPIPRTSITEPSYPRRLIQVRKNANNEHLWSALAPNRVSLRDDTRYPSGVELCVQQGSSVTSTAFVALNRWLYDAYVGVIGDSTRVYHSSWQSAHPYYGRNARGQLVPKRGRFGVACSTEIGVAFHSFGDQQEANDRSDGVLDIFRFDGRIIRRFLLTGENPIVWSLEIALDTEGNLFGLIRDAQSDAVVLLRQPLLTP